MTIKTGTIARTGMLIFSLVNLLLTSFGYNPLPFSDEEVYEAFTIVLTVVTSLVAWWKNNSFTKPAIKADEYLKEIKGE